MFIGLGDKERSRQLPREHYCYRNKIARIGRPQQQKWYERDKIIQKKGAFMHANGKLTEQSKGPPPVPKTVKADTTRYQAVPGARSAAVRNTDQGRNTSSQTLPTHTSQPLPGQALPMQAPLKWEPTKLLSATHVSLFRNLPVPATPLQWTEPEWSIPALPMQAPLQAAPAQVPPTKASVALKRKADGCTGHKETRNKKQRIGPKDPSPKRCSREEVGNNDAWDGRVS